MYFLNSAQQMALLDFFRLTDKHSWEEMNPFVSMLVTLPRVQEREEHPEPSEVKDDANSEG